MEEWAQQKRAKRERRELRKLLRQEERRIARANAAESFRQVAGWVRRWIWIPNAIFVLGALLYLGCVFGLVFVEWIEEGVR